LLYLPLFLPHAFTDEFALTRKTPGEYCIQEMFTLDFLGQMVSSFMALLLR